MHTRERARAHGFVDDTKGNIAGAVLPMALAVIGLLMLAAGAILSIVPALVLGGGFAVVAVAIYVIGAALDRSDRKRRTRQAERAAAARRDFESERARVPAAPRSPLADAAVAALTGAASEGGIWPPIGESGRKAPMAPPTLLWDPPAAADPWEGNAMMEFDSVGGSAPAAAPRPLAIAGGGVSYQDGQAAPSSEKDFRAWPGTKGLDAWATFTGERRPRKSGLTEEDIKLAMIERRKVIAERLPTVGAILASVERKGHEATPRTGMTRGKCSQCESVLWAPMKRPIVLKCPGCGHKAKLF